MLDIDQFKQVNDTYGHIVGDQVLKTVASRCKEQMGEIDLIGRYGGDEFIFILVETNSDGARNFAEHIRQYIADTPIDTDQGQMNITVSMGIADLNPESPNLAALINSADNAMYLAKKAGRNKVE